MPRHRQIRQILCVVVLLTPLLVMVAFRLWRIRPDRERPGRAENAVDARGPESHREEREQAQTPYLDRCPLAGSFDFPVGPPDARGYYNAQPFGKNGHLGEDWNGIGGGNTDLGDPIHAAADGIVFFARDIGAGWGLVVRVYHNVGTLREPAYVESLYAHFDRVHVKEGDLVKKGQQLGTMGNVGGRYYAHLHFEIREKIGMPIGSGYGKDRTGFVDPTAFIRSHRGAEAGQAPKGRE